MVTEQSKGFIGRTDDQGRAGRVNGDRQVFGNRQAIRRTGGTVGVRVVGQARGPFPSSVPSGFLVDGLLLVQYRETPPVRHHFVAQPL